MWHPRAVRTPVESRSGGTYVGGPYRAVWHKTEGKTLAGALLAYLSKGCPPQFTIAEDGVLHQHIDTERSSYALRNTTGGVETNRDSAVQIEVVGFSGVTANEAQLRTIRELIVWLEAEHGIPQTWPGGRPPTTAAEGYGLKTRYRVSNGTWDLTPGHYGHSQVPENLHWDPAWTDVEWWVINERLVVPPVVTNTVTAPTDTFRERVLAKPVLRPGDTGQDVRVLQGLLIAHSAVTVDRIRDIVDGTFGPATAWFLAQWQGRTGDPGVTSEQGTVGPHTWAWLVGV